MEIPHEEMEIERFGQNSLNGQFFREIGQGGNYKHGGIHIGTTAPDTAEKVVGRDRAGIYVIHNDGPKFPAAHVSRCQITRGNRDRFITIGLEEVSQKCTEKEAVFDKEYVTQ